MRVRCIAELPSAEQGRALGTLYRQGQVFPIKEGNEYVALGLGIWGGTAWVEIAENDRVVAPTPLFLFEIVDGRPSSFWEVRKQDNGTFLMWPPLFYEHAFHDRLCNGAPELVDRFCLLRLSMEAEAVQPRM